MKFLWLEKVLEPHYLNSTPCETLLERQGKHAWSFQLKYNNAAPAILAIRNQKLNSQHNFWAKQFTIFTCLWRSSLIQWLQLIYIEAAEFVIQNLLLHSEGFKQSHAGLSISTEAHCPAKQGTWSLWIQQLQFCAQWCWLWGAWHILVHKHSNWNMVFYAAYSTLVILRS